MSTCVGTDARPSLCFVVHNAFGALTGGAKGHIGGVERQTSLMAKWSARAEYSVSMLTWDEGQEDGVTIDGVRVYTICPRDAGVPIVRFFHPRWSGLVRAMRRADADLYYQNCSEVATGQVARWCLKNGRKFVYSIANDPDCDPRLPKLRTIRERVLYRYGLRHADRVISQTRKQQDMLRDGFGVESVVVPMPCPGPAEAEYGPPQAPAGHGARVLWIGRICEAKRPDRLLELARALPDLTFDLVGPDYDGAYGRDVCDRARRVPNIVVHGPVPRSEVPGLYRRSACLCCTSDYEGFPNTFLEAWSHGLPVASMFDPDNLIADRGLGSAAGDVDELAGAMEDLLASPEQWGLASANCRRYYLAHHTPEGAMRDFERIFADACGSSSPMHV